MACTRTATLWLTDDGKAYFEGIGADLGTPNSLDIIPFDAVSDKVKAVAAAPYASHVLFITDAGGVVAVGAGEAGQLGDGKSKPAATAVPVDFSGKSKKDKKKKKKAKGEEEEEETKEPVIVSVAVGARSSLAVSEEGKVYAWGAAVHTEVDASDVGKELKLKGVEGKPILVAAGSSHGVIATDAGQVITFGKNNGQGVLGRGGEDFTPVAVPLPGADGKIVALAAGESHTLVLTSSGQEVCLWRQPDRAVRCWFSGEGRCGRACPRAAARQGRQHRCGRQPQSGGAG